MPSHKRRIPSYCRHKASGQAVVQLDGQDVYLGPYGSPSSRAEYERRISEWLARKTAGVSYVSADRRQDFTVNELLACFLDHAKTYYVKNGLPTKEQENLRYAMKPLAELYGPTAVREFGPSELKTVRQVMVDRDLCRNVVNARVNRIRRIFRWGVESELVEPNTLHAMEAVSPLKRGRTNALETERVEPVADSHVQAVLKVAPPTLAVMIEVQWLTGMRPGEVVIMRACDIQMSGADWLYRPSSHKTQHFGIERIVPLGPRAQALLLPFLREDPQAFLFSPLDALRQRRAAKQTHRRGACEKPKTKRRVGDRYNTQAYGMAVRYACKAAGVPPWHPNQLRHSAATRIRRDYGYDAARALLGHKTYRMTETYAGVSMDLAVEAMKKSG